VRTSIEEELLAREGYRRGLENSPKVQREISMWRDYYLAQMLKDKIIDTIKVSEQEVKNYYKQQQELKKDDEVQVDIVEILNDTLSVLKKLKKEIENGADIRKLASLHTKRKWTRAKGGEFGYFQSTMYGVIGEKARAMKVGELYGPVKTPVGYSLFKLIGKKTPKVKAEPFAKVRNKMWRELHGKKVSRFFIAYTVKLANQFGVSIDNNLLKSL
jgi:peptidyl-prolyl cis-trans isomerase C